MAADKQAAVGGFVLGGLVLAVSAIVLFGKFQLFNPTVRAVVVFEDSISGLTIGAPVTFRGVRVGAVENIALQFDSKTGTADIPVTVQLDPGRVHASQNGAPIELSDLIARGLRAELNTQSFVTGQSEIDLDFDPQSSAVLHPGLTDLTEIPTRPSELQRVKEQISQLPVRELVDNANVALQSVRTLSEKLDRDLPPLVDSLKATSDKSAAAVDAATQAIKDLQGRLDVTLADVSRLAVSGDKQLNERGAELHTLLASTNQSILQAGDLLGNLKDLSSQRASTRENIDAALRDLAAASASLRGFANDIEHNPQLLLTGRRP